MTNTLATTRERFEKEFHEQDWGWGSEGYSTKLVERIHQPKLLAFIEKELALRDAHHKALRAKELGEIRERIDAQRPPMPSDPDLSASFVRQEVKDLVMNVCVDRVLALLDSLIEKPQ
jgi:hypothetical protein